MALKEKQKLLGSYIRWTRKGRGYTLRALAEKIGIDHAHLSRIETNQILPSDDTLKKIAVALDAPHLFMIANRKIPTDLFNDIQSRKLSDMLGVVQKGITDEINEETEKERIKYPSDDPFRSIIPDHPDVIQDQDWFGMFESINAPYEWIFLPPPIRSKAIEMLLKWRDQETELIALEHELKKLLSDPKDAIALSTTAENAGYYAGFEKGLIEAFQTLKDHLKKNPYWFFAFFFSSTEARLLASFYDLLINIESSPLTFNEKMLHAVIDTFANLVKISQISRQSPE